MMEESVAVCSCEAVSCTVHPGVSACSSWALVKMFGPPDGEDDGPVDAFCGPCALDAYNAGVFFTSPHPREEADT